MILRESAFTQAVALVLPEDTESGPIVAALGEHRIAGYIVECARRHGIPIVERPELCEALSECELDDHIPADLFEAAAVVLNEVTNIASRAQQNGSERSF